MTYATVFLRLGCASLLAAGICFVTHFCNNIPEPPKSTPPVYNQAQLDWLTFWKLNSEPYDTLSQ